MKKILSIVLCLLMVLMSFSGCEQEEEKAVITMVLENNFWDTDGLTDVVEFLYPDIVLDIIRLPLDEAEREAALQNIRVGVMAGQGPDVFILGSWELSQMTWDSSSGEEYPRVDPLFESVEDAMNNGTFLPLDEYMANSPYFGPEKQPQVIMDAGKTEQGQVVLPLYYSVPMYLADKAKIKDPDADLSSLDALLESGEDDLVYTTGNWNMEYDFPSLFTHYEDENNNLTLTEEEFTEAFMYAGKFFEAEIEMDENGYYQGPYYEGDSFFNSSSCGEDLFYQWTNNPDDVVPVVTHNIEDGVTAFVDVYGAVSAATQYPEEAFKVLEIFYSDEVQTTKGYIAGQTISGEKIKKHFIMNQGSFGRTRGITTCKSAFGEENMLDYKYVDEINSMITNVRFVSEFDCLMADAWRELQLGYANNINKHSMDYEAMVKELYEELNPKLKMIAAE